MKIRKKIVEKFCIWWRVLKNNTHVNINIYYFSILLLWYLQNSYFKIYNTVIFKSKQKKIIFLFASVCKLFYIFHISAVTSILVILHFRNWYLPYLDDEVERITGKGVNGEIAAGGHQGLKARPRSRDTATTHAACFISSPLRPASSLQTISRGAIWKIRIDFDLGLMEDLKVKIWPLSHISLLLAPVPQLSYM